MMNNEYVQKPYYGNKSSNFYKKYHFKKKINPPINMDKDLDEYASEVFYLIKARNCAVACTRYVLWDE